MAYCNKVREIGSYEPCDTIITGLTATDTGVHTIRIASTEATQTKTFTSGDAINFVNPFNEDAISVFQILNPSGVIMSYGDGSTCFRVHINSILNVDDRFANRPCSSGAGGGSGTVAQDVFTTVGATQAYVRVALSGKTINRITMGQTTIDPADYALIGTTLTFSNFVVPNAKKTVVDYE